MSPYIRSMLEDAADDGGRPVATDLNRIRSAGRRAVWRRRGLVGAGGLGVVAVVTAVAMLVPPVGDTAGDVAGSPVAGPTSEPPMDPPAGVKPWGPNPVPEALYPLVDAIAAAGYDVDLDGSYNTGVSGASEMSSSDGTIEKTVMTTAFAVAKDDAVGAVVVAEFTDVEMLRHSAVLGNDPPGTEPLATQQCAVLPPGARDSDFSWTACDKQPVDDDEVWRGTGGGPDADGLGVTLVRTDGSGLSITLSTAAFSYVGYARAYDDESLPTTLPPPRRLKELPLTHDALAEIVTSIAASGTVFSTEAVIPDHPQVVPGYLAECPEGVVIVEMEDAFGRTSLVDVSGTKVVCTSGVEADSATDVRDVPEWTTEDVVLEPWHFGLAYTGRCDEAGSCDGEAWSGAGTVPARAARISYELPDGQIVDAQIAAGSWIVRLPMVMEDFDDVPPIIVRVYGSAGTLLLEGDVNSPPAIPPPPSAPPAIPPPFPPPGAEESAPSSGEETVTP